MLTPPSNAAISIRIFTCEHYLTKFHKTSSKPTLDQHSLRVPVIRIFGSTSEGQICCVHVHNIYPYFYINLPSGLDSVDELFISKFKICLNTALCSVVERLSQKHESTLKQYIHDINIHKKISFYGYHDDVATYLKIEFYSPLLTKKAAELLQTGTIMNFCFQPYEVHIPYILKFFIDYELYGMDFIHLSDFSLRCNENGLEAFGASRISNFASSSNTAKFSSHVQYNEIPRQTNCEIELDCIGDDIIVTSKNVSDASVQNPGLKFIWADMESRLNELNIGSKLFDRTTHQVDNEFYIFGREKNFMGDLESFLLSQPAYEKKTIIPSSTTPRPFLTEDSLDARSQNITGSNDTMALVNMFSDVNSGLLEKSVIANATEDDVIETTLLDISMDEEENVINDSDNDDSGEDGEEASVSSNVGNGIFINNGIVGNENQHMEVEYTTDDTVEQSENDDLASSNNPLNVATLFDDFNDDDDEDFHLRVSTSSGTLYEDLVGPRNIVPNFSEEISFSESAWFSIDGISAPTRRQVESFCLERNVNPGIIRENDAATNIKKCKLSQPERRNNMANFRVHRSNDEHLVDIDTFFFVDGFYINGLDKNHSSSVGNERKFDERRFEQSYVLGSSLSNTFGFNSTELDLGRSKGLCSMYSQLHLVVMSVEVLCDSRLNLTPDPNFDRILAIFYTVYYEEKCFSRNGVIFAHDHTYSDDEIKQMWLYCVNEDIRFHSTDSEETMLRDFVFTVQEYDSDILVGYEIQSMSFGYLIERAAKLDIDLTALISRIPEISRHSRHSNADDWWFMADIHIAGRVTLNLWRLLRHEVSINIYTFENVAYHLLRIRCPKYSYAKLSSWFKNAVTCHHVIDYMKFRTNCNIELILRTDLVNRTSEFARLYGIQFFEVLSRGSQFRVEAMLFRLIRKFGYLGVSPSITQRKKMAAPSCIPLTLEPKSKFYTDPVIVLDFQSLYPSICIAYNYCYSTCLGKISQFFSERSFNLGCVQHFVLKEELKRMTDKKSLHISPAGVAFVKSEVRKGLLPIMLEDILNTRIMVKECMKFPAVDKNLRKILDNRQLGLKLIANVTYGYTSANFSGRMPCVEVADSIVHKGRETLERAIDYVNRTKKYGAEVIYGDTDSLFVLVRNKSKQDAFEIGKEIATEITKLNPNPVKLKFEKVYYPCVLQTKKRYVGYSYESVDQKEPVFDAKGIETVRRDSCEVVSKILEKMIHVLFRSSGDLRAVKECLTKQFNKILSDRLPLSNFIFAKEYRGRKYYKQKASIPALKIIREKLRYDPRSEPHIHERVPYVILNGEPGCTLISCVNDPNALSSSRPYELTNLNYEYYIVKQIGPALNRILNILGADCLQWYREMGRNMQHLRTREETSVERRIHTMSQYLRSAECLICRSKTLVSEQICGQCLTNSQELCLSLKTAAKEIERKILAVDNLCQICSSSSSNRSKVLIESCISLDCPIYSKRLSRKLDLNRLKTRQRLIQDLL